MCVFVCVSLLQRLDELVLLVMVAWLALRIARLTAILQKIRERRRRGLEVLDVAFPDINDDDDDDEEMADVDEEGRHKFNFGRGQSISPRGGGGPSPGRTPTLTTPMPTVTTPTRGGCGSVSGGGSSVATGGDEGGMASPIGCAELAFLASSPCHSPLACSEHLGQVPPMSLASANPG